MKRLVVLLVALATMLFVAAPAQAFVSVGNCRDAAVGAHQTNHDNDINRWASVYGYDFGSLKTPASYWYIRYGDNQVLVHADWEDYSPRRTYLGWVACRKFGDGDVLRDAPNRWPTSSEV